ncbi:MAG: hypothetical protein SFY69_03485 [Planctomycetota bacterium]|nr:hypothetical protein [Planctomycetota bacterium]
MRARRVEFLAGVCSVIAGAASSVAQEVARPSASGRIVRIFDFEERETNPGEVPDLWYRDQDDPSGVRRPGFPPWNRARVAYGREGTLAYAGQGAVELPTRGGSTSLVLAPGAIPVFPNADYRIGAYVRTQGLRHARAVIEARFLDAQRRAIPGETYRSAPVVAPDQWTRVEFEAVGRASGAAWLQLELLLLQPESLGAGATTGEHHVRSQDFDGSAWFDDLSVVQLPRVEITTGIPGNVFTGPDRPEIDLLVRDLTGEALTIIAEVLDASGAVVATSTHRSGAGLFKSTWRPELPRLGWYRARTRVRSGGREVDGATADFAWIPASASVSAMPEELERFSIDLLSLPESAMRDAEELVQRAGAGHATLDVWTPDLTPELAPERARALLEGVGALLTHGRGVSLSVSVVPDQLATSMRLGADRPLAVLASPREHWEAHAVDLFETLGPRVPRWRFGLPANDADFWNPSIADDLQRARASLGKFIPSARLSLCGGLERDWSDVSGCDGVVLRVPPDMPPEGVRLAVEGWRARADAPELTLVFEPVPGPVRDGVANLARQVVEAWLGAGETRPPTMTLADAYSWVGERRPALVPRPTIPAWRTLADHLRGRRYAGDFPAAPGVRCIMLAPSPGSGRPGALVAWSEVDTGAVLESYLGPGPVQVTDLDGNTRGAPTPESAGDRRPSGVRIALTTTPVFIEGVDMGWCRFLASLRLDPATLDSAGRDQDLAFEISGTWKTGAAGSITILEPGGHERGERDRSWRISPRQLRFHVGPGEVARVPFSVGFSPVEESGTREMVLEVEVQGEKAYGPVEVRRTFEIGSRGLRLELAPTIVGADLIVDAIVSNAGEQAASLRLTAFAPNAPRIKAVIPDLPRGNQATRRFRFDGLAERARGQRVMVVLEDPESGARLVRSVQAPDPARPGRE